VKSDNGFGLIEVLISMTIFLVVLATTLGSLNDALSVNEKTNQMTDLEQNLRSGMNLMVQDFIQAGWGIPVGGLPIPSGEDAQVVHRPGPPGTAYTFSPALTIASVNPGANLGPIGNGRPTDIVNILYADNLLPLNQTPLDSIGADGRSIVVNAGTPISGVDHAIVSGDLIALSNSFGCALQCVTGVNGQRIMFAASDPLNLNQPQATQGSILMLRDQDTRVFPPTTATRVWLVTYYLDTTTDPEMPRLIRRVNARSGSVVALVLEDLQLSYDLVDGVANPTDVETPTAPNSPNQIRKVNVFLSGRSNARVRNSGEYLRRSLTTQVSFRSLSFVDRY